MSQLLDKAEALRQQALGELLAERNAIDEALQKLGYDGAANPVKHSKVCSVCSSPDHNARFHKKAGAEAPAPIPTV